MKRLKPSFVRRSLTLRIRFSRLASKRHDYFPGAGLRKSAWLKEYYRGKARLS